jgi:hypothetical protein
LKLACWSWRRRLKTISIFLLFCYYLPLGEGVPLHLNNLEFFPPKDDLCHVWSKLAQWIWTRSRKCNVYRQTDDGQRTNDQKSSRAFSAGELIKLIIQSFGGKFTFKNLFFFYYVRYFLNITYIENLYNVTHDKKLLTYLSSSLRSEHKVNTRSVHLSASLGLCFYFIRCHFMSSLVPVWWSVSKSFSVVL